MGEPFRTKIGSDDLGNSYYEVDNPGRQPNPKREITYANTNMDEVAWHDVPPEWRLWVKHARKNPPTQEEVLTGRRQRELTLKLAKEHEAEDARRRSKQIAEGTLKTGKNSGANTVDPLQFLQRHFNPEEGGTPPRPDRKPGGKPGGSSRGQGQTFVPGEWDPNENVEDPR